MTKRPFIAAGLLVTAVLFAAACSVGNPQEPVDLTRFLCCAPEQGETCAACYERISTCCHGDKTFGLAKAAVAAGCSRDPACRDCCNECAALECEKVKAYRLCPARVEE